MLVDDRNANTTLAKTVLRRSVLEYVGYGQ